MATYKVIQDIEAEDKLLGPLTLRQFIYGIIAAGCLYLTFLVSAHGAAFLSILFLPIAAAMGFFAFPWGRDQPTEIWALAKIRFLLKPRRRIWNQSGIKELVTITAPKHAEINYTNGLSESEVRSRLHALASTIDSRGWAVKNANLNLYSQEAQFNAYSDRLVTPAALPQPVESVDVQAADDILDETNNASAQRLTSMINQSTKAHHDKLMAKLSQDAPAQTPPAQPPANYWFLNQPTPAGSIPSDSVTFNTQVVTPQSAANDVPTTAAPSQDDAAILAELEKQQQQSQTVAYGHWHTIQPLSAQAAQPPQGPPVAPAASDGKSQNASASVTPTAQAAILRLAGNDDLNVATIAREAERSAPQDEVVIKLH